MRSTDRKDAPRNAAFFTPLLGKTLPQYPVLRRPQPRFLPQCERPNFTLNRKKYLAFRKLNISSNFHLLRTRRFLRLCQSLRSALMT